MKVRGTGKKAEKIEPQMAPMIDVVFQLLIFFMLTLKIVADEVNYDINLPPDGTSASTADNLDNQTLKVKLRSNKDGLLTTIALGEAGNEEIGNDDEAFRKLNARAIKLAGYKPSENDVFNKDAKIEITADYNLHFRYTIRAIGECTRTLVKSSTGEELSYKFLENITFTTTKETP